MTRFLLRLSALALALLMPVFVAHSQAASYPPSSATSAAPEAPLFDDEDVKRGIPSGSIDGKVAGLNANSFATFAAIKRANPNGLFTEANAMQLRATLVRDKILDGEELDLLQEMTQGRIRWITVTLVGSDRTKVLTLPTSGKAKKVLQETFMPPLNLNTAWALGRVGWNQISKAYKDDRAEETRILNFVSTKLEAEWAKSNQANAYKPMRDAIVQYYGYSGMPGGDVNSGRMILYKATKQLDAKVDDAVPDFLYSWTRPGGLL